MKARRSFATLMVLWVAAIAGVIIAGVQASAYSQSSAGRDALARARAYWAARAGVEFALARAEFDAQNPETANAYHLFDDLSANADRRMSAAAFRLAYSDETGDHLGVRDAHSKLNLNALAAQHLILLPDMPEDGPDSILDWVDEDDDTKPLGAERGYYESLRYPYKPRNAPFRSVAELELVIGMTPELVRGEDWNLNGRLDANEDDGDASWPPDNSDGDLFAGLSAILTTASVDGGLGNSGEARLDLATATSAQIAARISVDAVQATAISTYAASSGATMSEFIRRDLRQLAATGGGVSGAASQTAANLTRDQLAELLSEGTIGAASSGKPGKLNINTCEATTLEYLPELTPALADAILFERSSRPEGFLSITDLLDVPTMTRQRLSRISNLLDVRSTAIIVSSRGRDARTGIEVEIVATIDRSALPAVLSEFRVQ